MGTEEIIVEELKKVVAPYRWEIRWYRFHTNGLSLKVGLCPCKKSVCSYDLTNYLLGKTVKCKDFYLYILQVSYPNKENLELFVFKEEGWESPEPFPIILNPFHQIRGVWYMLKEVWDILTNPPY